MDNKVTKIKETPLCKLAYKYGTDKCPKIKHGYTPHYFRLFKSKIKSVRKVVEFGIGYYKGMKKNNKIYDKNLDRDYHKGASLKMWRDFFPNAQIYGADVQPDTLFKSARITTLLCDELKYTDIVKLLKVTGSDIDIVIDDASHNKDHQVRLAQTLLPLLDKKTTYIIEDVTSPEYVANCLSEYYCKIIQCNKNLKDDNFLIIKSK